jgi:hypothetical protein
MTFDCSTLARLSLSGPTLDSTVTRSILCSLGIICFLHAGRSLRAVCLLFACYLSACSMPFACFVLYVRYSPAIHSLAACCPPAVRCLSAVHSLSVCHCLPTCMPSHLSVHCLCSCSFVSVYCLFTVFCSSIGCRLLTELLSACYAVHVIGICFLLAIQSPAGQVPSWSSNEEE